MRMTWGEDFRAHGDVDGRKIAVEDGPKNPEENVVGKVLRRQPTRPCIARPRTRKRAEDKKEAGEYDQLRQELPLGCGLRR
jgi:hypothetical protein